MDEETKIRRAQLQREAVWKWRWLGWRDSTPAFKGTLALLAVVAIVIGVAAFIILRG